MNAIGWQVFAGGFAFLGLLLSLTGNIYCETIAFQPNSVGEAQGFPHLAMGLWSVRRKALYKYDPIYDDPFFVVGNTCVDYPSGSEFDTKWESAIALSITSWVLSGLASIVICGSCCLGALQNKGKILGCFFLLVTLFQGLSLLVLASDGCTAETNPVFVKFPGLLENYADECSMSRGSKMNISSTVFYFVAALALLKMPVQDEQDSEDEISPVPDDIQEKEMEEQPVEEAM